MASGHEQDVDDDRPPRLDAAELFRRWAAFVARLLARTGVPPCDLDDAVQEVFLTAHRRGGFVPDRAHEKTWLAEIAVRVASNQRRSTRRRSIDGVDPELAGCAGVDPCEAAELRERIDRVARALATLPVAQRVVFVLYEIEGDSGEAIALDLNVPVGTVYSRLHVARRAFRAAYEAGHAADETRPVLMHGLTLKVAP